MNADCITIEVEVRVIVVVADCATSCGAATVVVISKARLSKPRLKDIAAN